MKPQLLNFIICLLLFSAIAQGASDQDDRSITWMYADFPLLHIVSVYT